MQNSSDLQAKGYTGSADAVRRLVSKRMAGLGKPRQRRNAAQPRSPPIPSARNLAFELIRRKENRKLEEQHGVEKLQAIDTEFAEMLMLTEHFIGMIRKEEPNSLTQWLQQVENATSVEVRVFAKGIRQDEAAVNGAITQPWSNGQVEGVVNKLKVIKRQLDGRARFALLRQRVLYSK